MSESFEGQKLMALGAKIPFRPGYDSADD